MINLNIGARVKGRYDVKQVLGQGTYGKVFKVVDVRSGGEIKALKIAKKKEATDNEYAIGREFRHSEWVVHMCSTFEYDARHHAIVMEFISDDLSSMKVRRDFRGVTNQNLHRIGYEILCGVEEMHAKGFLHRDLKLENIGFVFSRKPAIKILDLGLAAPIPDGEPPVEDIGFYRVKMATYGVATTNQYRQWDDLTSVLFILLDCAGHRAYLFGGNPEERLQAKKDLLERPAQVLKNSPVESLTLFAKCMSWPATVPPRHKVSFEKLKAALETGFGGLKDKPYLLLPSDHEHAPNLQ